MLCVVSVIAREVVRLGGDTILVEIKEFVGHKPKEIKEQSEKKIKSTTDKALKKGQDNGKKKEK